MRSTLLKLAFAGLSLFSSQLLASDKTDIEVGLGYEFGGIAGVKYNYTQDNNRYFASLGLVGGAVGYQRLLKDNKSALGLTVGSEVVTSEKGFAVITYHYSANGIEQLGWLVGFSAGVAREDEGGLYASKGEINTDFALGLSLGYRF